MSKIYVVRHGQSTWNAQHRWAGHANPELTELGRQQAADSCKRLQTLNFSGVCSSNLSRARETASIISNQTGLDLIAPIPDLNEQHYGELSGLTSSEITAKYPQFMAQWQTGNPTEIPGGEMWLDFTTRVFKSLKKLSESSGNTLVVAHLGVLRAIEHYRGEPQSKHENLGGLWVEFE